MKKILFITATRLGDGVLSTGALAHFINLYPDAEITVACGPIIAGLFRNAPCVKHVIPMEKEPLAAHWVKLWRVAIRTTWDIVIDLRNSLMTRLIFAQKKYIWSGQLPHKHKVEQIAAVIKAFPAPEPTLWFSEETIAKAAALVPDAGRGPVLAIGPAANWLPKTWPAENFIALAERLTSEDGILPGARVAVFAAPGEEQTAYKVLNAIPPELRIDVIAKAEPVVVAAAIQRCQFYVGNDSGLMHCAAAAGVPTLGLFGPSWPQLYRPWGARCAYVSTPQNFDQLINYPGYDAATAPSLMTSLTIDMAHDAAVKLWKEL